jgi:hypothetical protein
MGGDGRRDGELTVIDGVAHHWRWTAQRQLDDEGRRNDDSTTMDDEEGASAMAMFTRPAVRAIDANAALNCKM